MTDEKDHGRWFNHDGDDDGLQVAGVGGKAMAEDQCSASSKEIVAGSEVYGRDRFNVIRTGGRLIPSTTFDNISIKIIEKGSTGYLNAMPTGYHNIGL